jgi:hypothetical protein
VQLLGQDQEDPEFTKFDDIRKRLGIDTHRVRLFWSERCGPGWGPI